MFTKLELNVTFRCRVTNAYTQQTERHTDGWTVTKYAVFHYSMAA